MDAPNVTNPVAPDTLHAMREARQGNGGGPRISLLIYHRDHVQVVSLAEGQSRVVGRDPSADIAISDDSVSRRHARFEVVGGAVWVVDLGSTNGTKLNGRRVDRAPLAIGDEATLGSVTASIHALPPLDVRRHGLWTHDQFVSALEDEVERARTFGRAAAVIMVRRPGADAGAASHEARGHLRSVDRVARYSPDTLELLQPEAGADVAAALAHRLLAAGGPALVGIAVYPGAGTSAEALLEVAREALRRATPAQPVQHATAASRAAVAAGPVVLSAAMIRLYETVERLATSVIPVLLLGETGCGKEVLAHAIHERGPRRARPLACINCGAIPATLIESVLFGHERGAFTGATGQARGLFEEAAGGSILLDEVGELSPSAQAALLRVLETKQVRRVGASHDVPVDVRVIAATHRDLEAMTQTGAFRADLLYRLNAMILEIPPLRERPEEINPLAERFIAQANAANGREVRSIDDEARRMLHRYPWPGNIRELRNTIERAVVIAETTEITVADLPRKVQDFAGAARATAPAPAEGGALDLRAGLQRFEEQAILEALRQAGGNRTEAARRLGVPVRTLSHKIKQHGIRKLGFGAGDEGGGAGERDAGDAGDER